MSIIRLGDIYIGWGKRWRVVDIRNGTVKIEDVTDPRHTFRGPRRQFKDGVVGK